MKDRSEKSFVKIVENIWYHYKWAIIIGGLALVMLIAGIAQLASKKAPDVFIYHVSSEGVTVKSVERLTDSLSEIASDYNRDGVVNVDFKEEIYIPDVISAGEGQLSVTDSFNLELFAGECVIYIMDESFYLGNRDYMVDLVDVLGYVPKAAYDDKALLLSQLPAYESTPGLMDLPEESFICVRKERVGLNEMDETIYANNLEFFRKFVEFASYSES